MTSHTDLRKRAEKVTCDECGFEEHYHHRPLSKMRHCDLDYRSFHKEDLPLIELKIENFQLRKALRQVREETIEEIAEYVRKDANAHEILSSCPTNNYAEKDSIRANTLWDIAGSISALAEKETKE